MKMNFKEVSKRITGISVPFFGVSWNPPESERKIAKRIISFLEDRRVLYSPYDMEMPMHCVESIIEIRKYLTDEIGLLARLNKLDPHDDLAVVLKIYQDIVKGSGKATPASYCKAGHVDERVVDCVAAFVKATVR